MGSTCSTHCICLKVIAKARRSGADVVIMDRYIYDELANLPLSNWLTRLFIRVVATLVPRPDVAYILDADPEAARARKPEYPVDFMRLCRSAYLRLAQMLGSMTVIPPLPLMDAKHEIERAASGALMVRLPSNEQYLDTVQPSSLR